MARARVALLLLLGLSGALGVFNETGCECDTGCWFSDDSDTACDWAGDKFCYLQVGGTVTQIDKRASDALCRFTTDEGDLDFNGACLSETCHALAHRCVSTARSGADYTIDGYAASEACDDGNAVTTDGCSANAVVAGVALTLPARLRAGESDAATDTYVETGEWCDDNVNCAANDYDLLDATHLMHPALELQTQVIAAGSALVLKAFATDPNADAAAAAAWAARDAGHTWAPQDAAEDALSVYDAACCWNVANRTAAQDCHTALAECDALALIDVLQIKCLSADQDVLPGLGCNLNADWSVAVHAAADGAVVPGIISTETTGGTTMTITSTAAIAAIADGSYEIRLTPAAGRFGALNLEVYTRLNYDAVMYETRKRDWRLWVTGVHRAPVFTGTAVNTALGALNEGAAATVAITTALVSNAAAYVASGWSGPSAAPGLVQGERFKYRVTEASGSLLSQADGEGARFAFVNGAASGDGAIAITDAGYAATNAHHTLCDTHVGHTEGNDAAPITEFQSLMAGLTVAPRAWYHSGYETSATYGVVLVEACSYNAYVAGAAQCTDGGAGWTDMASLHITVNPVALSVNTPSITLEGPVAEGASGATVGIAVGVTLGAKATDLWILRSIEIQDVNYATTSGSTSAAAHGYAGVTFACAGLATVQTADAGNAYKWIFAADADNAISDAEWGTLQASSVWGGCTASWPTYGERPLAFTLKAYAVDRAPGGAELALADATLSSGVIEVSAAASGLDVTVAGDAVKSTAEGAPLALSAVPALTVNAAPSWSVRKLVDGFNAVGLDASYGEGVNGIWIAAHPPAASALATHLAAIGLAWTESNVVKLFSFSNAAAPASVDAAEKTRLDGHGYTHGTDLLFKLAEPTAAFSFTPTTFFESFGVALNFSVIAEEKQTSEVSAGAYAYAIDGVTVEVTAAAPAAPVLVVDATHEIAQGGALALADVVTSITCASQFGDERPYAIEITFLGTDDAAAISDIEDALTWTLAGGAAVAKDAAATLVLVTDSSALETAIFYAAAGDDNEDYLAITSGAVMGASAGTWDLQTATITLGEAAAAAPALRFSARVNALGALGTGSLSAWSAAQEFVVNVVPALVAPSLACGGAQDCAVTIVEDRTLAPLPLVLTPGTASGTEAARDRLKLVFSSAGVFNLWFWDAEHTQHEYPAASTQRLTGSGGAGSGAGGSGDFTLYCAIATGLTEWSSASTLYPCAALANRLFVSNAGAGALAALTITPSALPWAFEYDAGASGWDESTDAVAGAASTVTVTLWDQTELGTVAWGDVQGVEANDASIYTVVRAGWPVRIKRTGNTQGPLVVRLDMSVAESVGAMEALAWEAACSSPAADDTKCLVGAAVGDASASVTLSWASAETTEYVVTGGLSAAFGAAYVGQDAYVNMAGVVTFTVVQVSDTDLPLNLPTATPRGVVRAIVGHTHLVAESTPAADESGDLTRFEYDQLAPSTKPVIKIVREGCASYKTSRAWGGRVFSLEMESLYSDGMTSVTSYLPSHVDGVAIAAPCGGADCVFNAAEAPTKYTFVFAADTCEYNLTLWGGDALTPNVKYSFIAVLRQDGAAFERAPCGAAAAGASATYVDSACYYSLWSEDEAYTVTAGERMDRDRKVEVEVFSWNSPAPETYSVQTDLDVSYGSLSWSDGFSLDVTVPNTYAYAPVISMGTCWNLMSMEAGAGAGDNAFEYLPSCSNIDESVYNSAGMAAKTDLQWLQAVFNDATPALANPAGTGAMFDYQTPSDGYVAYRASFDLDTLQGCTQRATYGAEAASVVSSEITDSLVHEYTFSVSTLFVRPWDAARPPLNTNPATDSVYMTTADGDTRVDCTTATYKILRDITGESTVSFQENSPTERVDHVATFTETCSGCSPGAGEACGKIVHKFRVKTEEDSDNSRPYVGVRAALITDSWGGSLTIGTKTTAVTLLTSSANYVYSEITLKSACVAVESAVPGAFNVLAGGASVAAAGTYNFGFTYSRCASIAGFATGTDCSAFTEAVAVAVEIKYNHDFGAVDEESVSYSVTPNMYVGGDLVKVGAGETVMRGENLFITAELTDTSARDHLSVFIDDLAMGVLRADESAAATISEITAAPFGEQSFYAAHAGLLPGSLSPATLGTDTLSITHIAGWIRTFAAGTATERTFAPATGALLRPGVFKNYAGMWSDWISLLILRMGNWGGATGMTGKTYSQIANALTPYAKIVYIVHNAVEQDEVGAAGSAQEWITACKAGAITSPATQYDLDANAVMCATTPALDACALNTRFDDVSAAYANTGDVTRFRTIASGTYTGFDAVRLLGDNMPINLEASEVETWSVGVRYYVYDCVQSLAAGALDAPSLRRAAELPDGGFAFAGDGVYSFTWGAMSSVEKTQRWMVTIGVGVGAFVLLALVTLFVIHKYQQHARKDGFIPIVTKSAPRTHSRKR